MSDTTPLRRGEKTFTTDVRTNDLKKHYLFAAAGFYAGHEYADLALILKGKNKGII